MSGLKAKDGTGVQFVEFSTGTIRRVCRSSLACEANAMITAMESADYLRSVILSLLNPDLSVKELMDRGDLMKLEAFTDAKSLHETCTIDTSRPDDKRVRVVVAQLREMLGYEGTKLTWIDNSLMIADALTKQDAVPEIMMDAVEKNCRSLQLTEEALDRKRRIRAGSHARAELARSAKRARTSARPVTDVRG